MAMNGIPESQHESELAAQAMRDKVNVANSRCPDQMMDASNVCPKCGKTSLGDKIQVWRKALEEIAGNESGVNADRADGIAIAALAFDNNEVSHGARHERN